MIQAFYSATAALEAHQTSLDIVANNMANVNTTAYKSKKEDFGNLLSYSMNNPQAQNADTILTGSGVGVQRVDTDMSSGSEQQGQSNTDYSINGNGFFAVRDGSGNTFYTQDGSFELQNGQNGTNNLVNADGMSVLDANGKPITTSANGTMSQPGVFDFPNSSGLISAGGNLFTSSTVSGSAVPGTGTVNTGELEESNVDMATQMTDLITAQRGYQLNGNVVSTADNIESMVNALGQ